MYAIRSYYEFRLSDINQNQNSELQTVNYTINDNTTLFSEPDMVTISINGGRKNKISAGDVLGALTSNQAIPGTDIGKIDRMDYLTFIAVKRSYAEKAYKILSEGLIKGREFKVIIHKYRITSYNVCYTKLLRSLDLSAPKKWGINIPPIIRIV